MVAVHERTRSRTRTAPRRKVVQPPNLRATLKLTDKKNRKDFRSRSVMFVFFVLLLITLFGVAFAQAELVSYQQDLDLITSRISDLEKTKTQLQSSVNEASAPKRIVERANDLGMIRSATPLQLNAVAESSGNG